MQQEYCSLCCKKVALNKEDMNNVSSKSDVNIMLRGKHIPSGRGSPSLVGRGIAKPYPQHYHQHPPLGMCFPPFNHNNFKEYLKSQNKRNVKQLVCYAQRYHTILETGDATILTQVKPSIRR